MSTSVGHLGRFTLPSRLKVFHLTTSMASIAVVPFIVLFGEHLFDDPQILVWVAAVAVVELFPIPTWGGASYTVSDPLLLALMLTFPAPVTFIACLIGAFDPREFRGQVSVSKALFNRSQCSFSYGLGSLVFHSVSAVHAPWASLVPAALIAAAIANLVNLGFVATAMSLQEKTAFPRTARALLMDSPREWIASYLCNALLGVVIARLYAESGSPWVIALPALPLIILGRRALLHIRLAQQEIRSAQDRESRVRASAARAAAERRDERKQLAAALHDEAIPTFQGINLLATSAAQSGSLDQLSDLLAEIRVASDVGSAQLRKIVGDLWQSDLGEGGISTALRRLIREERRAHPEIEIDLRAEDIALADRAEALLYQIGREAIVNALKHSGGTRVTVTLSGSGAAGCILRVADNGGGFDAESQPPDHFGVLLMKERAETLGAELDLQSSATGTIVKLTTQPSIAGR